MCACVNVFGVELNIWWIFSIQILYLYLCGSQKRKNFVILWWINTQPIFSSSVLALKIDNSSQTEERANRNNNWLYKVFNNCNRKTYRETEKQPVYIVFNQRNKTREKMKKTASNNKCSFVVPVTL